MVSFDVPEPDYDRYTNRQLVALPLTILAIALLVIFGAWVLTGAPAALGIEFTGGTELTVDTASDQTEIQEVYGAELENIRDVTDPETRYILTFRGGEDLTATAQTELEPVDAETEIVQGTQQIDPTFASETQQQAVIGLAAAFLGMSALAFVLFRTFIPSIAIVVSAFSDIMIPLAMMNVFGIELSLGTVAALLMLIGYSVDSDILLNTHILRRGAGGFYESTYRAMRTGVTMTVTSMAAMLTMVVVATFFSIDLLSAIGLILFVGLATDLMNTYMLNLSLLRWYKFEGVNR